MWDEFEEEDVYLGQLRPKIRIPIARAKKLAARMCRMVRPYVEFSMVAGSLRRKYPKTGDIELVVLPKHLDLFLEFLETKGFVGGERKQWGIIDKVKIEFFIAHDPSELGALILYATGDWAFNRNTRMKIKRMGLKLDQYGIWRPLPDGGEEAVLQSPYEEDFFEFMDIPYHRPEDRNHATRPKGYRPKPATGPREERKAVCGVGEVVFEDPEYGDDYYS